MKKSVVKLLQNFLLLGASILSGFAFYSCGEDAGLGGAIDTKAPSLSIDYPKESGSAIRDQFILAGTVTDDKSIARVTVNVKSLDDGGKISDTYSASFDPVKNRWWVDINRYDASVSGYYNGWQYPDGNYEFSVTAFDNAGNNSGTYSKTFEIDNTAPVFIISNPGVIKKTNLSASAYGSLFTIDGTISDNHTISFMDVKIYDASGKCVSSESYEGENLPYYREEDVATAGGTSVQIAQYSKEPSTALNNRYSQLHESESGTEYYYAEIKLTDSTKVYRNPWGEDARSADEISADQLGNSTSKLYLYDDVYASLMSAKKGLGLSAANLKDIISGVYSGSASKESVLQTLYEKVYDTSLVEDDPMANKLSFSLNPEANPTYNVNGFEFGFGDEAVLSASSGNTVSVTISAGLDKTNIAPEVVRVWMKTYAQKPTDQAAVKSDLITLGKEVVKFEKYNDDFAGFMDKLHETPENPATTITTGGASWVLIYDYSLNNSRSSSVSTKTFSVTLPDGIELSKYYILGVTGCDIEDLEFAQNTVYGFEGNTAGVPPTIDIETPDNLSVWANFAAPSFTGTASLSTKSLYVSELTASLSIIEDGSTKKNIGEFTDTITCKIENDEQVWSTSAAQALTYDKTEDKWHLDASKLPGLLKVYETEAPKGVLWLATLKVSGKSSSGHTGEKTLSVKIDTVAPVVSISSVTPTVLGSEYFGDSDTNTYLNGEISIKGNISDTNLLETEAAVTYDVLASIGDEEPVSILADLIANKEDVGADFDGKLGSVYSINESFDTRAISKFFHDFKEKGEDEKIKIEVVVTATDKAGNKGSYSSSLLNGGKNFVIYQETDRPKIELGNADLSITEAKNVKVNHNLFGTTSNNKLTINFSDDDSIAEYEVYVYDEKGELVKETEVSAQTDNVKANPYKYYPGKTTAALSYVLPSKEAKYQIEIKARDYLTTGLNTNPYGEKSVGKFFVAVDSGAPEVEISKPDLNSFQSGSIQVSGSVSKAVDLKGTLVENSQNAAAPKTFEIKSSAMTKDGDSYTWKWENTVANDGAYSIKVDVTDIYGQTAAKTRAFKVDTKSPEIKATTTSVDNNNRLVPLDEMEYITLKADVTDGADSSSVAGISVVKYLLTKDKFSADALKDENIAQIKSAFEGNDWTQMNQGGTVEETNVTSFNASVPVKTFATDKNYFDGEAYVYVATEDNVGNFKILEDPVVLNFDEKAPEIVVVDFDGSTEIETNGIGKATTPDQKLTVKVEDTNVDKLESGDVKLAVGGATELAGGKGKSFVVTPTWEGFLVNGETKYEDTKTATFTATDTHSRKSTKTVILKCDTYAPRVALTRKTGDTFSNSSSIELTGTIEDKNISGTSEYFKLYLVPPASTSFETKDGLVTFVKNGEKYEFTANITGLDDTEYNIAIIAKDSFGNEAKYSTDASKTTAKTGSNTDVVTKIGGGSISIDSLAPSSNIKLDTNGKLLDRQKASVTNANPHALDFGSTYYTDNKFILKGTITETNLVENASQATDFPGTAKPTLEVSKEGGAKTELAISLGANDGNGHYEWSYIPNYAEDGTADGIYEYTLTVWDKSKQSFSKTITVMLDTKKPELDFTSPSENESFESNPSAKVAYSDDGVGIKSYTYKLYSISDDGTEQKKAIIATAITNGSATGKIDLKDAVGTTEGSYKVTAEVEDYLGHKSELVQRKFYFDTNKPNVDETVVKSSGLTTNAETITLSGVVYDTNALYHNGEAGTVKISGTWNGQNRTVNARVTPVAKTVDGKNYTEKQYATWTYTFNTAKKAGVETSAENYLPDETYNFAIIATDTAGKTNQISRTVKVDTVAPQFGTGTENTGDAGYDATNVKPHVSTKAGIKDINGTSVEWYNNNSLRFEGTATDVINNVEGTGIKHVYYQVATRTNESSAWSDWSEETSAFAGTETWAGTIDGFKSKTQKIRVIVEDNAGNISEPVEFGPFNIDMTAPVLDSSSVTVDTNQVSEEKPFYSRGNKDNNSSSEVSFKVSDEENGSGIKKVYVNLYKKVTDEKLSEAIEASPTAGGSYTATIEPDKIKNSGTVYVRIYDYAGNYTDESLFAITFDATNPVINSFTLNDKTPLYNAYNSGNDSDGNPVYYVNNSDTHNFTLSGISTDNLGLKSAKLEIPGITSKEIENEEELSDWTFSDINLSEISGETATITFTDKAGNTAKKTFTIKVDTQAPVAQHTLDAKGKDLYFRIGDQDGIGGKYSPGTYGESTTIQIRGYFTEAASGLSEIYYKRLDHIPTQEDAKAFLESYSTDRNSTGEFTPLSNEVEETVPKNLDGGSVENETVKTNYNYKISGFTEGENYLLLVAVDKVGNAALDSIEYKYTDSGVEKTTMGCYSINVDQTLPVVTTNQTETILTNGNLSASGEQIEITGTTYDAAAGVKEIVAIVEYEKDNNGKKKTKTITDTESDDGVIKITDVGEDDVTKKRNKNWTLKINKSIFGQTGNFAVYVQATDEAGTGNKAKELAANITVDQDKPTVTLKTPTDAYKASPDVDINKTITLSGNVEDNNPLLDNETDETSNTVTSIQYTTDENASVDDDTGWISITNAAHDGMADFKITGNYSFEVTGLDTLAKITENGTSTSRFTDELTYYLRAKAVDKAGNPGYSNPVKVYVNQRSDRPILKFTNLTTNAAGEFILKQNDARTVEGTVTDDDSDSTKIVNSITVQELDKEGNNIGDATSVTITAAGDFTFTPSQKDDGSKFFKFTVVDNNNTTFTSYSSTNDYTTVPVLNVKENELDEGYTASKSFTYKADNEAPVIESVYAKASDSNGTAETNENMISLAYVAGGTKRASLVLTIKASDTNGIAGMTAVIKKNDGTVLNAFKSTNENSLAGKTLPAAPTGFSWIYNNGFTPNDTTGEWKLPALTVSELGEGTASIVITPYDNSGLTGNSTQQFTVDLSGPKVSISSHKNANSSATDYDSTGTQYNGIVNLVGVASDGNAVDSIKWYIPSSEERTTWSTIDKESLPWNGDVTNAAFTFDFTGSTLLDGYTANASSSGTDSTSTTKWYIIPIYFRAVDEYGNIGYSTDYAIKFNPDLDKPKSEIGYPTSSTTPGEVTTLGGTIRMTGTATIPDGAQTGLGVSAVYVQIGASDAFGDTDKTKAGTGSGNYGYTVVSAYDVINEIAKTSYSSSTMDDTIAKKYGFEGKSALENWWGIKTTTTGWRLNLNENGEMNPTGDSTNNVYLRVCAVNSNGKFGVWSDNQYIAISKSAPGMSGKLYQFTTAPSPANVTTVTSNGNVIGEKEYTSGMYIKGQWYIETTAKETNTGSKVTIESVSKDGDTLTRGTQYFVTADKDSSIKVYIPVDENAQTTTVYKVTAVDGSGLYSATDTYSINVDNTAPEINPLYSDFDNKNAISMTKIENSNYKYDFYSKTVEEGAGLDFMAVYFKRGEKVEIPLPTITSSTTQETKVSVGTAYTGTLTRLTSTEEGEVLYGVSGDVTCETSGTNTIITSSLITSDNSFIRKGSLVKLSGSYYPITEVDTAAHKATVATTFGTAPTTAFFAAAIAVNTSGEGASTSVGTTTISKDDGDGFMEAFDKSGTNYAWQLQFFSDELKDGVVDIVVVAADKAGNYSTESTTVMLTNHKPRISKVFLATDLNGDKVYTDDEFAYTKINNGVESTAYAYSALDDSGNEQLVSTLSTGTISIRDGMAVTFEMLGASNGNAARTGGGDNLYYIPKLMTSADATENAKKTPATGVAATAFANMNGTEEGKINVDSDKVSSTNGFVLTNANITTASGWANSMENGSSLTSQSVVQLTIWDDVNNKRAIATDDTKSGDTITEFGNQYTIVNIPVYFDMTDDVAPNSAITPFYWNKAESTEGKNYSENNSLYFKVEGTEGDYKYTPMGHIELGDKPAVSGVIKVEGTVSDDQRLSAISVTYGGTAVGSIAYTASAHTWASAGTIDGGYVLSAVDTAFGQGGHKAKWTLLLDTAKYGNADTKDIIATATQAKTATVEVDKTKSATYSVSAVPYITGISRPSGRNTYHSSTGRTSVIEGEILTVTGFNFGTVGSWTIGNSGSGDYTGITNSSPSSAASFTLTAPANSGALTVTSTTASLNNANSSAKYNEEVRKSGEDEATFRDDRYVYVWNVNHTVSGSSAISLMPTMDFDASGRIYTTWAQTGKSTIELSKDLGASNRIFLCYDQPTAYSAIGVEKSTGNMGVTMFPDHLGNGGQFTDRWALANGNNCGGAGFIAVNNNSYLGVNTANTSGSQSNTGRSPLIGVDGTAITSNVLNPNIYLDNNVDSPYYQVGTHEFARNLGSFSAPQTARYGNYGHSLYYDETTGALKYTVVTLPTAANDTSNNDGEYNGGRMFDTVVIDGPSAPYDRQHETVKGNPPNGYRGFRTQSNYATTTGTAGYYKYDYTQLEPSDKTRTSCTVTFPSTAWKTLIDANGAGLAFLTTDRYDSFPTRDATNVTWSWDNRTATFTFNAVPNTNYTMITVYAGHKTNVTGVGGRSANTAAVGYIKAAGSAGDYSSIDITSTGSPVIMYKAGTSIRLAYTTSRTPAYSDWTVMDTGLSGGLYVSMKIDTDDNDKLHAVYKNGSKLMYVTAARDSATGKYTFEKPETIDSTGSLTMSTLSLYGNEPVVTYLNSESSEDGVKYAKKVMLADGTSAWDYSVIPAVVSGDTEYYVSPNNYRVYVGANAGNWSATQDSVKMKNCEAFVGYKTSRIDVVFLKKETVTN